MLSFPGYVTLPTALNIVDPSLHAKIVGLVESAQSLSNPTLKAIVAVPPRARTVIAKEYVSGVGTIGEPAECVDSKPRSPVALKRLQAAYEHAQAALSKLGAPRSSVEIFVVDNGFLGAHMTADGLKFRDRFPDWAFSGLYDGTIGPILKLGPRDAVVRSAARDTVPSAMARMSLVSPLADRISRRRCRR